MRNSTVRRQSLCSWISVRETSLKHLTQETENMNTGLAITATLLAILLTSLYIFHRRLKSYWSRRNVPTVAENVLYGVLRKTINLEKTLGEGYGEAYELHKDMRYFGTFMLGKPTLVITDPEIIKHVLVKDFTNFNSHGLYINPEKDPLSAHLFNLEGDKWKAMRSKLTVAFTSGKIKYMFDTLQSCINQLFEVVDREVEEKGNVINMRDKLACLGTDVISSVAFGIEANSLKNPNAEFREVGRMIFTPTFKELMRSLVLLNAHWLANFLGVRVTHSRPYNFVMDMVKNTVDYREKNKIERNDFLNLLIQLKNKGYVAGDGKDASAGETNDTAAVIRITLNEIAAQVYIFYVAGFETTSTLISFTLYKLSIHKDIQKKVQEECDRVLKENEGRATYEGIQSMEYTDKVIHETLRFYPPLGAILRVPIRSCKLPTTDITLDKGTPIAIPIFGLHMDPQYFPDPRKFDPERFSDEGRTLITPYTYMPFGEGPRTCIGMRFGLVQVKSVLLGLLSRYDFDVTEDTPNPLKLDPKGLVTAPTKLDFVLTKRRSTVL